MIEGLRLNQAHTYFQKVDNSTQWWLDFLRRAGASNRINLQAVDSHINQVNAEAHARRKKLFPLMKGVVWILRHSRFARQALVRSQNRYTSSIYQDLFERYCPDLVIASTGGPMTLKVAAGSPRPLQCVYSAVLVRIP